MAYKFNTIKVKIKYKKYLMLNKKTHYNRNSNNNLFIWLSMRKIKIRSSKILKKSNAATAGIKKTSL